MYLAAVAPAADVPPIGADAAGDHLAHDPPPLGKAEPPPVVVARQKAALDEDGGHGCLFEDIKALRLDAARRDAPRFDGTVDKSGEAVAVDAPRIVIHLGAAGLMAHGGVTVDTDKDVGLQPVGQLDARQEKVAVDVPVAGVKDRVAPPREQIAGVAGNAHIEFRLGDAVIDRARFVGAAVARVDTDTHGKIPPVKNVTCLSIGERGARGRPPRPTRHCLCR